jgi:hypothetical protein
MVLWFEGTYHWEDDADKVKSVFDGCGGVEWKQADPRHRLLSEELLDVEVMLVAAVEGKEVIGIYCIFTHYRMRAVAVARVIVAIFYISSQGQGQQSVHWTGSVTQPKIERREAVRPPGHAVGAGSGFWACGVLGCGHKPSKRAGHRPDGLVWFVGILFKAWSKTMIFEHLVTCSDSRLPQDVLCCCCCCCQTKSNH